MKNYSTMGELGRKVYGAALFAKVVQLNTHKILIMLVGLPRSGKSTAAKSMNYPIVNPDSIRIALHGKRFLPEAEPMVWAIAKYMVAALFEAGHDRVILDATNTTIKRRDEWADKRWIRDFNVMDSQKKSV